jgi:hypothetical protein
MAARTLDHVQSSEVSLPALLNTDLLYNPYNWIVVILMLAIAVFGLHLIAAPLDQLRSATLTVV